MYLFIGPRGKVREATQAIQEVTRGSFFEKWNRHSESTNEIMTRGTIWNNLNLIKIIKVRTKTQ